MAARQPPWIFVNLDFSFTNTYIEKRFSLNGSLLNSAPVLSQRFYLNFKNGEMAAVLDFKFKNFKIKDLTSYFFNIKMFN